MSPTKAEILTELKARLDTAFTDPQITDKRHILRELAETESVLSALSPSNSSGGISPGDIAAGVDASTDIDLIKGLLTDIKLELVNSKSIADILIQDSGATPRYFIRQDAIDQTTGTPTITILNLDGTVPSPAPVLPLTPVKAAATNQVVEDLYIAIAAGTGYAIGDSISNVRLLDGGTGTINASLWYNLTSGLTIGSPPPIANIKGYADKVEELLVSIASKGRAIAASSTPVALSTETPIFAVLNADLGSVFTPTLSTDNVSTVGVSIGSDETNYRDRLDVEATIDGTTWRTIMQLPYGYVGMKQVNTAGYKGVRVASKDYVSGNQTVVMQPSIAASAVIEAFAPDATLANINLVKAARLAPAATFFDFPDVIYDSDSIGTPVITRAWGISQTVAVLANSPTGSGTVAVTYQKDLGGLWVDIYKFPVMTEDTLGVFSSVALPQDSLSYRYQIEITGTLTVRLRFFANISNAPAQPVAKTRKVSVFNSINLGIDLPIYGRVRRMIANNRTTNLLFLQIHDKATPVVNGNIPIEIYQLPTATLSFSVADFDNGGTILGAAINPRVAISTTFSVYTAPVSIAAGELHFFAELI